MISLKNYNNIVIYGVNKDQTDKDDLARCNSKVGLEHALKMIHNKGYTTVIIANGKERKKVDL